MGGVKPGGKRKAIYGVSVLPCLRALISIRKVSLKVLVNSAMLLVRVWFVLPLSVRR